MASGGHFVRVKTVGLKTLKNKLGEYVRAAASGETVVITDRGRPVAELVPPHKPTESVIERGIREGWITPATDRSGKPPPRKPIPGYTLAQLLADLDKDREDRW